MLQISYRKITYILLVLVLFSLFSAYRLLNKGGFYLYYSDLLIIPILSLYLISIIKKGKIKKDYLFLLVSLASFLIVSISLCFLNPRPINSIKYLYVYSLVFLLFLVSSEISYFKNPLWFVIFGDILALLIFKSYIINEPCWIYVLSSGKIIYRHSFNLGFGHSNTLVYPLILTIFSGLIISLRFKVKNLSQHIFIFVSVLIQVIAVLLLLSRSGIILLSICFMWFSLRFIKKTKFFLLLILLFFIITFLMKNERFYNLLSHNVDRLTNTFIAFKDESRINLLKTSLNLFSTHPWKGIGFANIGYFSGITDRDVQTHNIFFEIFCSVGIIGGFLYLLTFFIMLSIVLKNRYKFSEIKFLVFFIILSFMIEPIYSSHHFSIFLGLFLGLTSNLCISLKI